MWSLFSRWQNPQKLRRCFDVPTALKMQLEQARATGRPRGLIWVSLRDVSVPVLVYDSGLGWLMLLAVEVQFAPVPGSDMEDIPHAAEARQATAFFVWKQKQWLPAHNVLLNLTPDQAIERSDGKWVGDFASGQA